jgi:hypothetical protein
MSDVGERGTRHERGRRLAGVLVVAALFSLPALEHAGAGRSAPPASPAPAVRLVEPQPWQAFRAGAAVRVVATAAGAECTVGWDDGTLETLPARGGTCVASRVVRRPGLYLISVAASATSGAELRVPVVVYDPHAGRARGSGETGGLSYSVEAGYLPWRRTPAPSGTGSFEGPDGLSAKVTGIDWVLVTPEATTAVKGTAVAADGTAYGFVLYGQGFGGRTDPLRLTDWHAVTTPGPTVRRSPSGPPR